MKTALLAITTVLIFSFCSSITAQNSNTSLVPDTLVVLKPKSGDIGFGLKALGLKGLIWENDFDSLSFQFRKVKDARITYRCGLNISFNNFKISDKTIIGDGGYYYQEATERQFLIGLAPGIERHFKGTRRLDPYVGATLSLAFVGKQRTKGIDDFVDDDGSFEKIETNSLAPGGFGLGLDGFIGFNYYVAKKISIGLEYSLGLSLIRIKGKFSDKITTSEKSSPTGLVTTSTTETDGDEVGFSSTYFGNKGVAGLSLIFYLGR